MSFEEILLETEKGIQLGGMVLSGNFVKPAGWEHARLMLNKQENAAPTRESSGPYPAPSHVSQFLPGFLQQNHDFYCKIH